MRIPLAILAFVSIANAAVAEAASRPSSTPAWYPAPEQWVSFPDRRGKFSFKGTNFGWLGRQCAGKDDKGFFSIDPLNRKGDVVFHCILSLDEKRFHLRFHMERYWDTTNIPAIEIKPSWAYRARKVIDNDHTTMSLNALNNLVEGWMAETPPEFD